MNKDVEQQIASLRRRVQVAEQEVGLAIAFHEAWKPAARDKGVQAQMGRSLATHTFVLVRAALRREVVMALARLWGKDRRELGLKCIAESLSDPQVMDAICCKIEQRRGVIEDEVSSQPEVVAAVRKWMPSSFRPKRARSEARPRLLSR